MTATATAVSAESAAPYLARQPILSKDERVIGYEVLFREDSAEPQCDSSPGSRNVVHALESLGLDMISDGHFAFIPCSESMLMKDALLALPAENVVAQISQDVAATPVVVEACKRLRERGRKIALDSFRPGHGREPLLSTADFVKVHSGNRESKDHLDLPAAHAGKPYKLLAQNIDTRPEYKTAEMAGFTLFQGYFFRHPERMKVRQIPASHASKLRLLQAISKPEIDFKLVDELIRHDASLCYRLLRYLNSPLLGFAVPITSVRHAVTLLGQRPLTQWIRTATTLSLGQPKCSDLVLASLVRARFCELIAPEVGHGNADLFLLGMFSLMDSILETSMELLVEGLAFDTSAKAALLAVKVGGGTRLSPICDLMVARERGDWERVTMHAEKLGLSLPFVNQAYIESMQWAHELTRTANASAR